MFKLLGFIIGSAISIAGILLVIGVPELHLSDFESDQARFDAALQKIREKQAPAPEPPPPPDNSPSPSEQATANLVDNIGTQLAADFAGAGDTMTEVPEVAATGEETIALPADPVVADVSAGAAEAASFEQQWQDIWTPFRSEIAARGFVSQLERVTGLDYRIIKIKAGEYQVGFAYHDDDERQLNIQQISAATGLELREF